MLDILTVKMAEKDFCWQYLRSSWSKKNFGGNTYGKVGRKKLLKGLITVKLVKKDL
jgi:hypothetical protein